jgi:hypothetical protein
MTVTTYRRSNGAISYGYRFWRVGVRPELPRFATPTLSVKPAMPAVKCERQRRPLRVEAVAATSLRGAAS